MRCLTWGKLERFWPRSQLCSDNLLYCHLFALFVWEGWPQPPPDPARARVRVASCCPLDLLVGPAQRQEREGAGYAFGIFRKPSDCQQGTGFALFADECPRTRAPGAAQGAACATTPSENDPFGGGRCFLVVRTRGTRDRAAQMRGRGPDAGRTIGIKGTDADRTRAEPFLSGSQRLSRDS
eukprot:gene18612-biopygen20463